MHSNLVVLANNGVRHKYSIKPTSAVYVNVTVQGKQLSNRFVTSFLQKLMVKYELQVLVMPDIVHLVFSKYLISMWMVLVKCTFLWFAYVEV